LFFSPLNTFSRILIHQSIGVYSPLSSFGTVSSSHYPEKGK
jgi:hypothetical protein